jgi:Putative adhesin
MAPDRDEFRRLCNSGAPQPMKISSTNFHSKTNSSTTKKFRTTNSRTPQTLGFLFLTAMLTAAPPQIAAAAETTFDRALTVKGPVRIELNSASGSAEIRGSSDGQVHIHGKVTGGWSVLGSSAKDAEDAAANPPIEQVGDTIRIGRNWSAFHNVSIDYKIEVPHDTELDANFASGGLTVDNIRGPVKAGSASGYLHVYRVDRDVQLSAASGALDVSSIGGMLRATSASGSVRLAEVKNDIKVSAQSGSIEIRNPGERVDASTVSGSVRISNAKNDVKSHVISGGITITGNPAGSRLWDLKTVSGGIDIRVPSQASFLLSAESVSGGIKTNIPVVIEEQSRHSLRAHVGDSSGRVEVRTVSGSINVESGS